jgi:hypothetical protein
MDGVIEVRDLEFNELLSILLSWISHHDHNLGFVGPLWLEGIVLDEEHVLVSGEIIIPFNAIQKVKFLSDQLFIHFVDCLQSLFGLNEIIPSQSLLLTSDDCVKWL